MNRRKPESDHEARMAKARADLRSAPRWALPAELLARLEADPLWRFSDEEPLDNVIDIRPHLAARGKR